MTEHPDERLVRDALEDYRAAVLPSIEPPGVAATRETARYQRRRRFATGAVAAVLALVAGGTATYAATRPHAHQPVPATSHTPAASPTPSTGASPRPSGGRSTPGGQPPDGRISLTDLDNATLNIPGWPKSDWCQSGRYTFDHGVKLMSSGADAYFYLPGYSGGAQEINLPVRYADVDGDGAEETVAVLACGAEGVLDEVVAFDRDTAGHIVTLGVVDQQPLLEEGSTYKVDGLRTTADGTIEVHEVQLEQKYPLSWWSGFRWTGSGFRQVSGPAQRPGVPSVSWSVTSTMHPTSTGYQGTLRVTVTNDASNANTIAPPKVYVKLPSGVSAEATGMCDISGSEVDCHSGKAMKPGDSWTAEVPLTSTNAHQDTDQTLPASAQLSTYPTYWVTGDFTKSWTVTLPAAS